MSKTCLNCEHFYYSNAEPGYGEYTPGSDFAMFCNKNKWNFDAYDTRKGQFAEMMATAEICEHFTVDKFMLEVEERFKKQEEERKIRNEELRKRREERKAKGRAKNGQG